MSITLTARETADILRRRNAKGRKRLSGPKLVKLPSPKADRGRVRDPGFLAYLRRLPCVACVAEGLPSGYPIEAAHIRFSDAKLGRVNPGMQAKPSDRWATPLCRHHHQHDQHTRQERAFWAGLGVEPGALSTALYEAYQANADGIAVIDLSVCAGVVAAGIVFSLERALHAGPPIFSDRTASGAARAKGPSSPLGSVSGTIPFPTDGKN